MSEAELHILRQRLLQGKLQKAKRGELSKPVPSGYLRRPSGEVVLDPDEQARAVIQRIFDCFDEIGTVHGLLRDLVKHDIQIGIRLRTGDRIGELEWHRPYRGMLLDILRQLGAVSAQPSPAGQQPIFHDDSRTGKRCFAS